MKKSQQIGRILLAALALILIFFSSSPSPHFEMGCCYVAQAVLILVSLSRLALNLKQLFCFSLPKASYHSNFFPAKLVLILIPCKIQILQSYYCFFPLIVCAFLSVCACSCMCMCGCVDARGGIWVPFLRIAFWGSYLSRSETCWFSWTGWPASSTV